MSLIIPVVVFVAVVGLGVFFWFWYAVPRKQVPLHLDADQIKQLEVQDRLRQTSYQVLAGVVLFATFIAGVVQFGITSHQWTKDHNLRLRHELSQQFSEAVKSLIDSKNVPYAKQATQRISALADENPKLFGQQALDVLESVVVARTKKSRLIGLPRCTSREDPPPDAQVAIRQLGQPNLAPFRAASNGRACSEKRPLELSHAKLDSFDLSLLDLSCSSMSQASLRRVSLRGANLFGADLRGAQLADYDITNSPANTGELDGKPFTNQSIGFDPADPPTGQNARLRDAESKLPRLPVWETYRCFITDMRHADLRGANFEGASLGGVDFRNADLTGANLCGTNVSRANFIGAKGLDSAMFRDACVGKPDSDKQTISRAQPFGLESYFPGELLPIQKCPEHHTCLPRNAEFSNALINRPRR
jgi:uncharacterized protein YjbI with pentapeptide repeats